MAWNSSHGCGGATARHLRGCTLTIAVLLAALSVIGHTQGPVTLGELLRSAASYVAQYEREFSAVVSEERYEQVATRPAEDLDGRARSFRETAVRLLRSDVLLINAGAAGWIGYRDVFEVDGRPVRDRDERLFKLFLEPAHDALVQAKRIADESARFNLGTENEPLTRTINLPTVALVFLRQESQGRFAFTMEGGKAAVNRPSVVLRYEEQARPRIIKSRDDAATKGRFWIRTRFGPGRAERARLRVWRRERHGHGELRAAAQGRFVDARVDGRAVSSGSRRDGRRTRDLLEFPEVQGRCQHDDQITVKGTCDDS